MTTNQHQNSEPEGASRDQTYYNVDYKRGRQNYDNPRQQGPNYENVPATQGQNKSAHTTGVESNESKQEDSSDDDTQITENPIYTF